MYEKIVETSTRQIIENIVQLVQHWRCVGMKAEGNELSISGRREAVKKM